jgi:hypothetical protein
MANYFWCGQAATQKTGTASAPLEKTAALSKNIIEDLYVFLVNIAAKCHETFLITTSIFMHQASAFFTEEPLQSWILSVGRFAIFSSGAPAMPVL